MNTMADFYLYPRSPFDFSLSASIFAGGDRADKDVRTVRSSDDVTDYPG